MTNKVKGILKVIRNVQKNTGWNIIETINNINYARSLGMSASEYNKGKHFRKSRDELKAYVDKKNEQIATIQEKTGRSIEQINDDLKQAAKLGVNMRNYMRFEMWEASEAELRELGELLKAYAEKQKREYLWEINAIQEKTGCDREEAEARLDTAKKKGYCFFRFIERGIYAQSAEEIAKGEDVKLRITPAFEVTPNQKEESVKGAEMIMNATGWSMTRLRLNYFRAHIFAGANFHDYWSMELYKHSIEKMRTFITRELWMKQYLRYTDYAGDWLYFKNKNLFNEKFSEYLGRNWGFTKDLTWEKFIELFGTEDEVIYKPNNLACGMGIKMFSLGKSEEEKKQTFDEIKDLPEGMLESLIKQDPYMTKINPSSINTVRITTIRIGDEVRLINANARAGARPDQRTDNYSDGGVTAVIDMETGHVITDGVSKAGVHYEFHPVSGIRFKDLVIPNWEKAVETVKKAAKVVESMPCIGWDVVIGPNDNIYLIEGNHDAESTFHQHPWAICENKGIRDTVDKYLWFDEESRTI